jgi:hypothetical protein
MLAHLAIARRDEDQQRRVLGIGVGERLQGSRVKVVEVNSRDRVHGSAGCTAAQRARVRVGLQLSRKTGRRARLRAEQNVDAGARRVGDWWELISARNRHVGIVGTLEVHGRVFHAERREGVRRRAIGLVWPRGEPERVLPRRPVLLCVHASSVRVAYRRLPRLLRVRPHTNSERVLLRRGGGEARARDETRPPAGVAARSC